MCVEGMIIILLSIKSWQITFYGTNAFCWLMISRVIVRSIRHILCATHCRHFTVYSAKSLLHFKSFV